MKGMKAAMMALAMVLTSVPAMAVDTTKVYSSGILILVFIGVCALVVLFQMIPAIVLLAGMIKGALSNVFRGKVAEAPVKK